MKYLVLCFFIWQQIIFKNVKLCIIKTNVILNILPKSKRIRYFKIFLLKISDCIKSKNIIWKQMICQLGSSSDSLITNLSIISLWFVPLKNHNRFFNYYKNINSKSKMFRKKINSPTKPTQFFDRILITYFILSILAVFGFSF